MPAYRSIGAKALRFPDCPNCVHPSRTITRHSKTARCLGVYAPGIDCGGVQLSKTQLKGRTPDAEAKACKSRLSHVSGTQIWLVFIVAPDWIAHAKTLMSSSASGPSRCSTQDSTRPLFNRPSHPQQPYQTNLTSCALSVSSNSMHARCHFENRRFYPASKSGRLLIEFRCRYVSSRSRVSR